MSCTTHSCSFAHLPSHLCEYEVHSEFYHQTCYIMHRLVLETSVGCYRIIQAERCFSLRCSPRWKPFMLTLTNQKCEDTCHISRCYLCIITKIKKWKTTTVELTGLYLASLFNTLCWYLLIKQLLRLKVKSTQESFGVEAQRFMKADVEPSLLHTAQQSLSGIHYSLWQQACPKYFSILMHKMHHNRHGQACCIKWDFQNVYFKEYFIIWNNNCY